VCVCVCVCVKERERDACVYVCSIFVAGCSICHQATLIRQRSPSQAELGGCGTASSWGLAD